MVSPKDIVSPDYYFIFVKDECVLLHPSEDILKTLKVFEVVFKTVVSGNDDYKLILILYNIASYETCHS